MDNRIYAQIRKSDMVVNLIGGIELGIYKFDLPLAFTVDITDRADKDTIKIGMQYDRETNSFKEYVPEPSDPVIDLPEYTEAELNIMESQATIYEKNLIVQETQLNIMSGLADLYEVVSVSSVE